MPTDHDHMRAALADLTDAQLYARTVEASRMARAYMDDEGEFAPLDRAWLNQIWYEMTCRGIGHRFAEARKAGAS